MTATSNSKFFTPPVGDDSVGLLHQIFGAPVEHFVSGLPGLSQQAAQNAQTLGAMFGWFNQGILFFGSILLLWVTVFGVTNTANDGVALGKRWNTFYTPLRTLTASALLIPGGSGYSGIQLLILKIVLWGAGFASTGWGVYVSNAVLNTSANTVMRSVVDDSQFDALAAAAVRMQVCAYASNKAIQQVIPGSAQPLVLYAENTPKVTVGNDNQYTTTVGYRSPNWVGSDDICGKIQITSNYQSPTSTNDQGASALAAQLGGQITTTKYQFLMQLFGPSGVQPISAQIISATEGGQPVSTSAIRTQITQLRQKLFSQLQKDVQASLSANNSTFMQKLARHGWASAGQLYMEISRVKDTVSQTSHADSIYESGAGIQSIMPGSETVYAMQLVAYPYTYLAGLSLTKALSIPESSKKPPLPSIASFSASDFADGGNSVKSYITRVFKNWSNGMVQTVVYSLNPNENTDMIWQIKDLGDNIAGYSEAALIAGAAFKGALDGLLEGSKVASGQSVLGTNVSGPAGIIVGAIAGVKGFFISLLALLSQGLKSLLLLGYFFGIWIPMVPYFIFTVGVVGWVVVVVESLIAGSLWTVMHLTPESNDSFIGSQQQGYLILMSVFFRPALMILGLVCSVILLNPIISFVDTTFLGIFQVMQADSLTGLLSVAGFILAYGVVIYSTIMLIFSLPQTLPDRILRWVGAGTGDLGEQSTAQRIEATGGNQARTAMVAASGALRSSAGRSAGDAVRKAMVAADENEGAAPEGHTPVLTIGPGPSERGD